MTTNDEKIVTHEDLSALRDVKTVLDAGRHLAESRAADALVNRLIAAAEADQPPLPEGWYLLYQPEHLAIRAVWNNGRGYLYSHDQPFAQFALGRIGDDAYPADRLTPLRPTITEAQLHDLWLVVDGSPVLLDRDDLKAALKAAGIEVHG